MATANLNKTSVNGNIQRFIIAIPKNHTDIPPTDGILSTLKTTTLKKIGEVDDESMQMKFYLIVFLSFFVFFFGIVGYVVFNQWKKVQE